MPKSPFSNAGLILASGSPRRRRLLTDLGVSFDVVAPVRDEEPSPRGDETADDFAKRLALTKALEVVADHPERTVLGADTIVVLDDDVLGKPKSVTEATEYLKRLRGRTHKVITAVAVVGRTLEAPAQASTASKVRFRSYSDREIEEYVASGDPMDKAGAYAIQSELLRPAINVEGCMLNVIGLPLCLAVELLAVHGLTVNRPSGFSVPEACRRRIEGCLLAR